MVIVCHVSTCVRLELVGGFVSSTPYGEPSEESFHEYGEEKGGECAPLQRASVDGYSGGVSMWCHVVCT